MIWRQVWINCGFIFLIGKYIGSKIFEQCISYPCIYSSTLLFFYISSTEPIVHLVLVKKYPLVISLLVWTKCPKKDGTDLNQTFHLTDRYLACSRIRWANWSFWPWLFGITWFGHFSCWLRSIVPFDIMDTSEDLVYLLMQIMYALMHSELVIQKRC